jgi:hypothetical protein
VSHRRMSLFLGGDSRNIRSEVLPP